MTETAIASMAGIDQLRAELGERYSAKTVIEYVKQGRYFFAFAGDKDTYDRHEILAYGDHLLKGGKGQASLSIAWYTIKAICRAKNIPFPCREGFKGDQFRSKKISVQEVVIDGESHEVSGPTPDLKNLTTLIAWVRANGDARQKAYLALSSIYAMRAIEISTVNKRDDIRQDRLFVRTAKHGQPKWHRIPPEVREAIKGYKYPQISEQAIWTAFKEMRTKAGLKKAIGLTPHGIRRFLTTFFSNRSDLNPYVWYDFARWSQQRGDMIARYRHATPEEVDRLVFPLHPLLPLWGKE